MDHYSESKSSKLGQKNDKNIRDVMKNIKCKGPCNIQLQKENYNRQPRKTEMSKENM